MKRFVQAPINAKFQRVTLLRKSQVPFKTGFVREVNLEEFLRFRCLSCSWVTYLVKRHSIPITPLSYLNFILFYNSPFNIPLRFRKAGRMWCGGARETHWATCHNKVTVTKTKQSLKAPAFLSSYGMLIGVKINNIAVIFTFTKISYVSEKTV